MAFDSRLETACCSRPGSPITQIGISPSDELSASPLIAASPDAASTATWTTPLRSTSCGLSMRPPAAMRDAWSRSSMMRSRVRALRSMISRARAVSTGSEPACAKQTEPHQDRSQRRPQLVGEQRQELVLEAARVHRAMPRGLLPLQERGDVTDDPAAVDEPAVPKRGCSPRSAPAGWRRPCVRRSDLVAVHRLLATRAGRACLGGGPGLDEVAGDRSGRCARARSTRAAPGTVRFVQSMRPSGSTQHTPTGACSRNSTSSSSFSGGRASSGGLSLHQLRRVARLATTVISSAGCTGLDRCSWKPARSARRRSSVRA